jgi:hypothetical protein
VEGFEKRALNVEVTGASARNLGISSVRRNPVLEHALMSRAMQIMLSISLRYAPPKGGDRGESSRKTSRVAGQTQRRRFRPSAGKEPGRLTIWRTVPISQLDVWEIAGGMRRSGEHAFTTLSGQ